MPAATISAIRAGIMVETPSSSASVHSMLLLENWPPPKESSSTSCVGVRILQLRESVPSTVTLQLNGILTCFPGLTRALGKEGEICAVDPVLTSSQFIARDAAAEPVFSIQQPYLRNCRPRYFQ